MTQTNYPIDNALNAAEKEFTIDLLNKVTGANYPKVPVYGYSRLGDVLATYAEEIGVNPNDSKVIFENKRTGISTSEKDTTVEKFDLQNGDVLAISDNAGVAAEDSIMEIDILNRVTGTNYPKAPVYGDNTLGQVLQEYAIDIGVNPDDSKILFENKRTGDSTSDKNETVSGLSLQTGDVLAVSDNAGVA